MCISVLNSSRHKQRNYNFLHPRKQEYTQKNSLSWAPVGGKISIGFYRDKKQILSLSLTKAWITSKTGVSRRLDWPGRLSVLAKPGFVFAKNSRAKIVQHSGREREGGGDRGWSQCCKDQFLFLLVISITYDIL